jgi:hypothetical protein
MDIIAVVVGGLLLTGFICGYGARELISRRRQAKARRRHFERLAEEVSRTQKLIGARPEARLAIGLQSGDGGHAPPKVGGS